MANKNTENFIKANLEGQRYAFNLTLLEAKGLDSSYINYCWDCEEHKEEEIINIEYLPLGHTKTAFIRVCKTCLKANYTESDIDATKF